MAEIDLTTMIPQVYDLIRNLTDVIHKSQQESQKQYSDLSQKITEM